MARALRSSNRADLIVLGTCALLALVARGLPPNLRDPVATSLRRTFLAPLVMLQERAEASRRSLLLDQQRTAVRDSVALRAIAVASLENENYRLRLSPVIAPEGVVGMVTEVDPTMSQAMIWTHPDFRVSAMSEDGSAFGIVQGHLASATSGYLMELHGIPFRTALKPGTLIVSSGLGGVWPRGIPIGRVLEEVKTSEGWARTYLIKPSVSPADVGPVMILRPERVAKPFENVWANVVGPDEAARRIVMAGDSAARTAALAEAAALRAALDSTRDTTAGGQVPGGLPPELRPDTITRPTVGGAALTDSAARAEAARRAAARRAAARRDSLRRDSARRDSARIDSLRRDSLVRSPTRGN